MTPQQYRARLREARDAYNAALSEIGQRGVELATRIFGDGGRMSLREAARRTGLSPTYLSRVRSGDSRISPDAFEKLAALLPEDQ